MSCLWGPSDDDPKFGTRPGPLLGVTTSSSPQVPDIMSIIHSKLEEVDEEHVRKAAQQTVYILASQHKSVVVSSLLGSSLPFDRSCHLCRGGPAPARCLGSGAALA